MLFLSSLLVFGTFAAPAKERSPETAGDELRRYSFQIEMSAAAIPGIMLVKRGEASITGSMVNEFGISAVDFIYSDKTQKVKLVSVVKFLDKWYIRQTLAGDIRFCLHILFDTPHKPMEHKYDVVYSDNAVTIINTKRDIRYTFSPTKSQIPENDTEK